MICLKERKKSAFTTKIVICTFAKGPESLLKKIGAYMSDLL